MAFFNANDEEPEGYSVKFERLKDKRLANDKPKTAPPQLPPDFPPEQDGPSSSADGKRKGPTVIHKYKEKSSKHLPSMEDKPADSYTAMFDELKGRKKKPAPTSVAASGRPRRPTVRLSESRSKKQGSQQQKKSGGGGVLTGLKSWFRRILVRR